MEKVCADSRSFLPERTIVRRFPLPARVLRAAENVLVPLGKKDLL